MLLLIAYSYCELSAIRGAYCLSVCILQDEYDSCLRDTECITTTRFTILDDNYSSIKQRDLTLIQIQ